MFLNATRFFQSATTRRIQSGFVLTMFLLCASCSDTPPIDESDYNSDLSYSLISSDAIAFNDDANSQTAAIDDFDLQFVDVDGNDIDLKSYRGKKNVVLVVTRGVISPLCPFCTTQTSRLMSNSKEFESRNAAVLVVVPGKKNGIAEFTRKVAETSGVQSVDLPILLDKELSLVNRLSIKDKLAKPSTYILDRAGKLRFAYVGKSSQDRPSIKAMFKQLDMIEAEVPATKVEETPDKVETKSEPPK
jgi:peroxiredoxin